MIKIKKRKGFVVNRDRERVAFFFDAVEDMSGNFTVLTAIGGTIQWLGFNRKDLIFCAA